MGRASLVAAGAARTTSPPGGDMADAGPKLLKGLLEVFILESLEQSPKHGYALLKEMTEVFGAEPNRNRLYPLLARMVRDGHVREMNEAGGNRTLYTLTDQGRDALQAYRRLPSAFRHALRRIWALETHPASAPRPEPVGRQVPVALGPEEAAIFEPDPPGTDPAYDGDDEDMDFAPLDESGPHAPATPRGAPYPCADAKVSMERTPRSGALTLRLSGCPMGAYDYCPDCPIFQAVQGLQRLALGTF